MDRVVAGGSVQLGFWEVFILLMSVYVLLALTAQSLFALPPVTVQLLDRIDLFVCAAFMADFGVTFYRAPSKWRFMRWGWIDLLASIPVLDVFRWGRMLRAVRILRVLRAFRSAKQLSTFLYRNRVRSALATAVLLMVILVLFSTIAILSVETAEESNIRSPFDALWWAISTLTTVGYGDRYPVTVEGRVIAMVLMICGIGLFGVITGFFAKIFLAAEADSQVAKELCELRLELSRLRDQISVNRARGKRTENGFDLTDARIHNESSLHNSDGPTSRE